MKWYDEILALPKVISGDQLKRCMPRAKETDAWASAFNKAFDVFNLPDLAMVMAQVGHESMDLSQTKENMRYSAKRIHEVWPSRFPTIEAARPFANNPEALANRTYGGRLGNKKPGDGFRYIGRGPIQITGLYNYNIFYRDTGIDIVSNPSLASKDKDVGAMIACWYFYRFVTATTLSGTTKQIQGGQLGLADRKMRYNQCVAVLRGR